MMARRDSFCPTGKQGSLGRGLPVPLPGLDEAKYITGAAMVVDGAQTCRI